MNRRKPHCPDTCNHCKPRKKVEPKILTREDRIVEALGIMKKTITHLMYQICGEQECSDCCLDDYCTKDMDKLTELINSLKSETNESDK